MLKIDEIRGLRGTLRKLERELAFQLSEQGNCCNVTIEQCHTILELGKTKRKINLKTLADILGLDKSTVSRGIDSLVKMGLVIRKADENNRRNIELSLSENGKFTCNSINNYCDSYYKNIFEKIPGNKHKQVVESLNFFVEAMLSSNKDELEYCSKSCNRMEEKRRKI